MIKMMVVLDGGDVDMYKYCLYIMNFVSSVNAAVLPRSHSSLLSLPCIFASIASVAALHLRLHVLTSPPATLCSGYFSYMGKH